MSLDGEVWYKSTFMISTLLHQLETYRPATAGEIQMVQRLQNFLLGNQDKNPFARELTGKAPEWGHLTGSAWIIDPTSTKCLLLHHAKLGKWVQPGGHCDGEADVFNVARREALEETGLEITALQEGIFDVDIHEIPEYWNTPAHLHFDIRYLFLADPTQNIVSNHESRDIQWLLLDDAKKLSDEETVARMIRKTRELSL